MSAVNKKRCRKSKLVPRIYDSDDIIEEDNDVRLKEKEIPRKKLKINRENKNEDYNSENYITPKLQNGNTTPIQNYPASPMQFCIKVEVEEFNELDTNDNSIFEDEDIPTIKEELCIESVPTQVSVTTPSISDVDISKEAEFLLLQTEHIDLNANTSDACSDSLTIDLHYDTTDSIIDPTEKRAPHNGCYYILSQEDILSYQPDESNIVSKMLAIEAKNQLGRSLKSILKTDRHEALIQLALTNKKLTLSQYRDILFMYKCYICKKAWWHLYPFREHIREHDDEDLSVSLEAHGQESNLIAFKGAIPPSTDISDIDSDCWHCGKSYTSHKMSERNEDGSFNCLYCMVKFFTCTQLMTHEGVCCWRKHKMLDTKSQCFNCRYCAVIVFSENEIKDHLVLRHSVRSDIPMPITFKICPYCKGKYFHFYFHVCSKRTESALCLHCNRKFPFRVLIDLHLKMTKNDVECTLCGDVLEKECMMIKHLLDKHNNKEFTVGTTCTQCTVFFVFLDDQAQREHRLVFHKNTRNDRNKLNILFEPLLIPNKILTNPRDPLLKQNNAMKNCTVMNSVILTNMNKISVLKPNVGGGEDVGEPGDSQSGRAPKGKEPIPKSLSSIISINDPEDTDATHKTPVIEMETYQTDSSIDISHVAETIVVETEYSEQENSQDEVEVINQVSNIKQEPVDTDSDHTNSGYEQLLSKVFSVSKNFQTFNNVVKIERQNEDDPLLDDPLARDMRVSPNTRSRRIYKCKKCGFKDKHKEYRIHMMNNCRIVQEVAEGNMQTVCTKCNSTFDTMKSYLEHYVFHGYNFLTCPECLETFQNMTGMRAHINSHVKNSYLRLLLISRMSKQIKVFKCKKCKGKVVFENFFPHWESHLELQPPVNVKVEGDETTSAALETDLLKELIALLVTDRGRGSRSVKNCNVCHRHFDRVNDCKRHLIEHLLNDAYSNKPENLVLKCQICSEGFRKADRYKHHMRDHSFLPIYKCELCNKTFSDSSNFTKHKKVHNLRAFICDICGKKFQAKLSIEKHMQMHVVTGQINCRDCPKVFHSESAYKKHYKNFHDKTQLKFKCAICKKRFNCIKDKWDHLWQVHKERNGKADCPICFKSFRKYSDVKIHVRSDHNMGVRVFNIQPFDSQEKRQIAEALQRSLMAGTKDSASLNCNETLIVLD